MFKIVSSILFAALLIGWTPLKADSLEESAGALSVEQSTAIAELQAIGEAFMAWLGDRNLRLGQMFFESWDNVVDLNEFGIIVTSSELADVLVPEYIDQVPLEDPWGVAYEFRYAGDPRRWPAFAGRSAGRNEAFEGDAYVRGTYPPEEEFRDIVWVQNGFAAWPEF